MKTIVFPPARLTPLAFDLLTGAGLATFLAHHRPSAVWLLPALLFLVTLLPWPKRAPLAGWRRPLRPFASGLLVWPMRLFYWDAGDFAARVENLLLLATLFALFGLVRERRWLRRFLRRFNSLSLKRRLLAVFLGAELLFILSSGLVTRQGVSLVGDEPHYLAISQSLARDGDLNVFNQYFRGGYREFLDVEKLPAHGTWGKGLKKIYSYHLPGVSLTLLPFFLIKVSPPLLYFLARSYLGLFGALLAVLVYLFCLRLWRSRSLAAFVVLVFSLTAPVFFYSFHVFPELQAMLLLLGALYILLFKSQGGNLRCLWAGLLLGAVIFWGVKYALFVYPLTLGFAAYWLWRKRYRSALMLVAFPVFFQVLFFLYLHGAYGTFSPNAVYYGMLSPEQSQAFYETILKKITLNLRWETLLDYFLDQRDGLLLYNPFYFFAFPGLLLALRNLKRYLPHLLLSLPAGLFVLNHAFSTIRAGYCPQGRYLAPVAWALMVLALIYYRESRNRPLRQAFLNLPLYSLFVSAYQVMRPFTLYQPTTHDTLARAGRMFQEWSNSRIDLPSLLPSFIKTDNRGYLPNIVFPLLLLLLVILAVAPLRRSLPRLGVRWVPAVVFLAAFALGSLFPRLESDGAHSIPGPRGHPVLVHFSPAPGPGAEGASWRLCRPRYRMRIDSLLPLKTVEMHVQNRSSQETLDVTVTLFDAPLARRRLPPGVSTPVRLRRPGFRKLHARHLYQFELRADGSGHGAEPRWLLRLALR
ncbi:MAG: hypothetical protein JXO51_03510 [Candidatus Aminicenantes bacterium]|nr:hypothetical protein [Candidatus Aminicenantes bacterium]